MHELTTIGMKTGVEIERTSEFPFRNLCLLCDNDVAHWIKIGVDLGIGGLLFLPLT